MNQTNQLHDESHYKLRFEAKIYLRNGGTKVQDCVLNSFNEKKNHNPIANDSQINNDNVF